MAWNPKVWMPSQTIAKTDGSVVVSATFLCLWGRVHKGSFLCSVRLGYEKAPRDQMYQKVDLNAFSGEYALAQQRPPKWPRIWASSIPQDAFETTIDIKSSPTALFQYGQAGRSSALSPNASRHHPIRTGWFIQAGTREAHTCRSTQPINKPTGQLTKRPKRNL